MEYSDRLKESLLKYGVEYYIREIPDPGTWIEAVNKKPEFILSTLLRLRRPVLWIDSDAVIQRDPSDLFSRLNKVFPDVAYHIKSDTGELLSGTIYFNHNTRAISLLRTWVRECLMSPGVWDQRNLQNIVDKWSGSTLLLNQEDCHIFDSKTKPEGGPIIEHFQASRKHRRK